MKKKYSTAFLIICSVLLLSISLASCYDEGPDNKSLLASLASDGSDTGTDSGNTDNSSSISGATVRNTLYGAVQGTTDLENTWAWLGIPYARPPVGDLRWRAPQSPVPWAGTRNADSFCSMCPQYGNFISETGRDSLRGIWGNGVLVGKEDCLYLNIWRPQTKEKLPVFVFIHGGAEIIGRSDLSIYNGARLASREKLVVVTFNYRLGSLGWFAHKALRSGDPKEDSGNFGTLDTIKALEWIRDNIASFGGDPDNITISGQSAGGTNVYALLESPLSDGLFHRAIIMSAPLLSYPMSIAEWRAQQILQNLFIQDGLATGACDAAKQIKLKDNAWLADYLRSRTLADLFPPDKGGPIGMQLNAGPLGVLLLGVYEDGYVLPDNYITGLSSSRYQKVPIMIGNTTEELKLFLPFFMTDPGVLFDVMQDFDPDNPSAHLKELLDPILWPLLYVYDPIVKLGQFAFQGYWVDNTVRILKKHQDDVYVYKFAWDEEPYPFNFFIGAAHAMDLPFVFGTFLTDKQSLTSFAWSSANKVGREELSKAMMSYFAQFARTGNPNNPRSGLPEWKPWSSVKGDPKRIVFDTGGLRMSSASVEPSEKLNIRDILDEVTELIRNP